MKNYVVMIKDSEKIEDVKIKIFSTKEKAIKFYNEAVANYFEEYEVFNFIGDDKTHVTKIDGFCGCYNFKNNIDFTIELKEYDVE